MSPKLYDEIQAEQNHGRQKWGNGPDDFAHDDKHADGDWYFMIADHNSRAVVATPMERRQHLIKIAGLAISAIEAFDRNALNQPVEFCQEHLAKECDHDWRDKHDSSGGVDGGPEDHWSWKECRKCGAIKEDVKPSDGTAAS